MTRKHFEAMAATLLEAKEGVDNEEALDMHFAVVEGLSDVFKGLNDRFDRARFHKACGLEG